MNDGELAKLYEQFGHLVHHRCLALLGNSADAEDALQETFLRVRRYEGMKPDEPLAWLYTIAANCAFDARRKRQREQPESDDALKELDGRAEGSGKDPDRRALVGAVLRKFDEKTRTIGILHFLDGYTQEEVAAQTGVSRKTVGKKLKSFEDLFRKLWR